MTLTEFRAKLIPKIKSEIIKIFPSISGYRLKQQIKKVRNNQDLIIKNIKSKEVINVMFLVIFDSIWKYEEVYRLFEKDPKLEVAIGSRFIKSTSQNMPFHRKIILFLAKIFTFFMSQVIVSDPHNGYRMFKVSAIEKIKLTLDGFEYSSELVDQIAIRKLKFKEVPVNILYTEYSLSK